MANAFDTWRAKQGFRDFTGHEPKKTLRTKLDDRDIAGYALGDMVGVAYEATRDGVKDQYFHRFKKSARPKLVSKSDGSQLYIAGGKYKVTDRGVEDMPELFIVNPSSRRRKKTSSAAPKRRKKKASSFMANPSRRRRRRRAATTFKRNPATRRSRRRRVAAFRANPAPRRRRRVSARRSYRRNPSSRMGGKGSFSIMGVILPSIAVGVGAVGAELLMGYLPIPAALKSGPMRYAAKAAVSIAAGYAIARFGNKKIGEAFAMGGVAIAAHDMVKALVTSTLPGAQFGGWADYGYVTQAQAYGTMPGGGALGYYSPGANVGMGEYVPNGLGEYVH